jgi:signal transduction histidine kinase
LKISEEMGNKKWVAAACNSIGIIYRNQGNYSQALEYYLKCLQIMEELGNKKGIARTYNNIGDIYSRQGNYSRALECFLKSMKICRETGDKSILASTYRGMGTCYNALGENQKALDYLAKSLNLARDLDNPETVKKAAETLSGIFAQMGQYEEAYQHHVLFKEKSDALNNEENIKKITRLEMQYEFEKKQKQQELEQQKKDLEKEAELRQQRMLKYTFSGAVVLLALVFYTRCRLKVKVNRKLNKEIRERKKAEAELVKSMKLETVGILSGGIAHDFNNLLAVIIGNLSTARETLDDELQTKRFIDRAGNASNQAADLVRKFLTLSDGEWAERGKTTLTAVLEDTRDSSPQIGEIPFSISIPEDLKPLYGDERQLRQVMVNLLTNAHEAVSEMDEGKRSIGLSAESVALPEDNEWSLKQGEYVKVSVSDNGKGIAPDLLDKIFDPYFSTKQRGAQRGMGMGLAICHAIVEKHEGHISVTSAPGEGTTVDLYLPACEKGM